MTINGLIQIEIEKLPNPLGQALTSPTYRIPASQIPKLEDEIIEFMCSYDGKFNIEPEYWKGQTQYHRLIHANEGKAPHIVLKGRNAFSFPICKRAGDGSLTEIGPGERFVTHPLVDLDC